MTDWLASNLKLRADRDTINDMAKLAAEAAEAVAPLSMSQFFTPADRKAEQQRRAQERAEAAQWR